MIGATKETFKIKFVLILKFNLPLKSELKWYLRVIYHVEEYECSEKPQVYFPCVVALIPISACMLEQ